MFFQSLQLTEGDLGTFADLELQKKNINRLKHMICGARNSLKHDVTKRMYWHYATSNEKYFGMQRKLCSKVPCSPTADTLVQILNTNVT
jgi:hypothetical protein